MFITLTLTGGQPDQITVNSDHLISFVRYANQPQTVVNCTTVGGNLANVITVTETPTEIRERLGMNA
jgi:hypothetical protein